ncbi:MAG: hypothetical protein M1119_11300 [Firmicutes bacterium]|nr:hypothetical protein [Bacillota bacterium]
MDKTRLILIEFPDDLQEELNKYICGDQKTDFIIKAVRKEFVKTKQKKVIMNSAGAINKVDYPEFSTPDSIYQWVREPREQD